MAKMVVELKDAADRYQLLQEESRARATDLEKALVAAKEARSKIRATKEELNQAADIVSRKPFLLRTKFGAGFLGSHRAFSRSIAFAWFSSSRSW